MSATRNGILVAAALLLLAATPTVASAITPPQWAVAGFGAYSTYLMSDVNNQVQAINGATMGTGIARMEEVNNSAGFGGGIRALFDDRVLLGVDFERLPGRTALSASGTELGYEVPGNAVLASVGYLFGSRSNVRLGVGGGVGYYHSSNAKIRAQGELAGVITQGEANLKASGLGLHAFGMLDAAIVRSVHLEGLAGFRFANTGDVEFRVAGEPPVTIDGYSLDWSGAMTRLGLSFYLGSSR